MGSIDRGVQKLLYNYHQKVESEGFNQLNHKLHPHGIYSGGSISILNDTSIRIQPFLSIFEDTTGNKVSVRIETNDLIDQTVNSALPYIIARFEWLNVDNNFMDILSIAEIDLLSSDLILGKCIYDGSTLVDIDYSRKSWSYNYYHNITSYQPPFRVIPSEPYDGKVKVYPGGPYLFNGKEIQINTLTNSPNFTFPISSNGRTDVVYLDNTSTIGILQGADLAGAPLPTITYDKLPIAIISFPPSSSSVVKGIYINYIHPSKYLSSVIEGGTITAERFISTIATGTSPLTVSSTTKVDNLNVDLFDDKDSSYFVYGDSDKAATLITDANNITKSGYYELGSPYTNGPTAASYYITHIQHNNNHITQTAILFDSNNTYVRYNNNSSWTAWKKDWNEDNDGTGSGLDADLLDGINSGNDSGNIPISNGTVNTNLNSDLLDGQHGSYYTTQSKIYALVLE